MRSVIRYSLSVKVASMMPNQNIGSQACFCNRNLTRRSYIRSTNLWNKCNVVMNLPARNLWLYIIELIILEVPPLASKILMSTFSHISCTCTKTFGLRLQLRSKNSGCHNSQILKEPRPQRMVVSKSSNES
jgi:hypothetical protein